MYPVQASSTWTVRNRVLLLSEFFLLRESRGNQTFFLSSRAWSNVHLHETVVKEDQRLYPARGLHGVYSQLQSSASILVQGQNKTRGNSSHREFENLHSSFVPVLIECRSSGWRPVQHLQRHVRRLPTDHKERDFGRQRRVLLQDKQAEWQNRHDSHYSWCVSLLDDCFNDIRCDIS